MPVLTKEDRGVHACWQREERALKVPGASHSSPIWPLHICLQFILSDGLVAYQ